MISDTVIIVINIACIAFLVVMMIVLAAATRMKGGAGYVALVIVTTTVPVYLSNMARTVGAEAFLPSIYPAITLNAICFPALWFMVRSQLDKSFRATWRSFPHLLPAVVSLAAAVIFYGPMTVGEVEAERLFLESGRENLPAVVNDIVVFGQFFAYFTAMFLYVRRRGRFLRENYADSGYLTIRWIPNFLILFFVLFFIAFVAYIVNPRTDAWLIPVFNSVGMAYLVYNVIYHSAAPYIRSLDEVPVADEGSKTKAVEPDAERMKANCERILEYLSSTQAYRRSDLSLAMLAKEVGIPQKVLSRSINGYLNRNFFELVNEMRVGEAKKRLLGLRTSDYTVDSIFTECGFRSRSTFFLAFKKAEGCSPAQWLAAEKEKDR